MTAVLREDRSMVPMTVRDLDDVMRIESASYEFPWTRGNFIDSLAAGYHAQLLTVPGACPAGYLVAMSGYEEMHLLNLTVDPAQRRRGHAGFMLDALVQQCCRVQAHVLWLEVRESNLRAQTLYRHYGFEHAGMRRGYYPAPRDSREDAVVMSLNIGANP